MAKCRYLGGDVMYLGGDVMAIGTAGEASLQQCKDFCAALSKHKSPLSTPVLAQTQRTVSNLKGKGRSSSS